MLSYKEIENKIDLGATMERVIHENMLRYVEHLPDGREIIVRVFPLKDRERFERDVEAYHTESMAQIKSRTIQIERIISRL